MNHRTPRHSGLALLAVITALGSAFLVAAVASAAAASSDTLPGDVPIERWSSKNLPAGLPFSEAVRVGDLLFLSGQIGNLPGTRTLAPGGIREEARQTMENIRSSLAARGYGLDRLVKCTVMLADMAEWETFNEVYRTFFSGQFPARSAFGANGLALGARVEVECIAAVSSAPMAPMAPTAPLAPSVPAAPAPAAPPAAAASPAAAAPVSAAPVAPATPAAPSAQAAPSAPAEPASAGVGAAKPTATALTATSWRLVEIGGRAPLTGADVTLDFAPDASVSGRGPCNSIGGSVEIADDRIAFGPLRSTRKACANGAVNSLESDYLAALSKSARFVRDGDRLELLSADGAVLLRFASRVR